MLWCSCHARTQLLPALGLPNVDHSHPLNSQHIFKPVTFSNPQKLDMFLSKRSVPHRLLQRILNYHSQTGARQLAPDELALVHGEALSSVEDGDTYSPQLLLVDRRVAPD
jgi:hypothetical protein